MIVRGCDGAMVRWYDGAMVRWCDGTMVLGNTLIPSYRHTLISQILVSPQDTFQLSDHPRVRVVLEFWIYSGLR